MAASPSRARVLIVDDNASIHDDFRKILVTDDESSAEMSDLEADLFGESPASPVAETIDLQHAHQGEDAIRMVAAARGEDRPFAVAFVDVRMPPGIDGIETTARLWQHDPDLQVVICSAYSDYSWHETIEALGQRDGLLVLRKPFDAAEVTQMVAALSRKWALRQQMESRLSDLEARVAERTAALRGEMERRERLETECRLAHRLETVGQLSAGIAHEINTPMQYVGDNVHFLADAFAQACGLVARYRQALEALPTSPPRDAALSLCDEAAEASDFDYLANEGPEAIARTRDGIARVTEIVRAMRDFAHPGQSTQADADINRAVMATLTVCRNEYKYVANVETDLGEIPMVRCFPSELNQVFLNLITNASHAIGDALASPNARGTIRIQTLADRDDVRIRISDTGSGIPEAVRLRIFDPFFTTKEPGRGTGQGLNICRSIVVDKHQGSLTFETEAGKGTTFEIRLPVAGVPDEAIETAAGGAADDVATARQQRRIA